MTGTTPPEHPRRPVLFVSHGLGYDDELMYYGEILAELRRREPSLVVAVDGARQLRNPHALDLRPMFRLRSYPLPGRRGYARELHAASPRLSLEVQKIAPEVIVTLEFTPVALLGMAGSLALRGTGRVLLIETDPRARGGSIAPAVLAVKRWAAARAHVVLTNNEAGRAYAVEQLRVDPARLVVRPYLTSRPPGPPADLTREEGAPLRVLFANRLTPRKNAGLLVAAMAMLPAATQARIAVTILGDGPEAPALRAAVAAAGLGDRIGFADALPYSRMGEALGRADVLVNPTRLDYRSLAGFEGAAYGLALLLSDADGAANEIVVEGENGFVFASDDASALAGHLARLALDPALVARLRAASLARYAAHFSVARAADALAEAIRQARTEAQARARRRDLRSGRGAPEQR